MDLSGDDSSPDFSGENEELGRSSSRKGKKSKKTSFFGDLTSPYSVYEDTQLGDWNHLRLQMKQLRIDLQSEQETSAQLRKRLNAVEIEKLEMASKSNSEITALDSNSTKLRSQIEKGEALRQNLELEFLQVKRELKQGREKTAQYRAKMKTSNERLKDNIAELTGSVTTLQNDLAIQIQEEQQMEKKYEECLKEKEEELAKNTTEMELLKADRDRLQSTVYQQESILSDLAKKVAELEGDKKNQKEYLQETVHNLEFIREKEASLKTDLETALHRICTLEECIEGERATHLETKFNSEVIQLHVRDLENTLEKENSSCIEAKKAVETLTSHLRDMQKAYELSQKEHKKTKEKLDRIKQDFSQANVQMASEVDSKTNLINNMSKELEMHQKNFKELKEELIQAKKSQVYLEEVYGGSMRELGLLLQNFSADEKNKKGGKKVWTKSNFSPMSVLEDIRHVLIEYKNRIDTMTEEQSKAKSTTEKLSREIKSYEHIMWTKDQALEEAQVNYTRTAKELNRVRTECRQLEEMVKQFKVGLQMEISAKDTEKKGIIDLSEEIMRLEKKNKADEGNNRIFLCSVAQELLACQQVMAPKDRDFKSCSWVDITSFIQEGVSSLINVLEVEKQKISHLAEDIKKKECSMREMQQSYEEQLRKLIMINKECESTWLSQKKEIESYYAKLLTEVQANSKKNQAITDQVLDKTEASERIQHEMQTKLTALQDQVGQLDSDNTCLTAACSLLCGTVYPLFVRADQLIAELHIYEDMVLRYEAMRKQAQHLAHTLNTEMNKQADEKVDSGQRARKPPCLMVFRKCVIVVMAAHRLHYFGQNTQKMFADYGAVTGHSGFIVCAAGGKRTSKNFSASLTGSAERKEDQLNLVDWLSSQDLLHSLLSCTSELKEMLVRAKQGSTISAQSLTYCAKKSMKKLMNYLDQQFLCSSLVPATDETSLMHQLGKGLKTAIHQTQIIEGSHFACDSMTALQQHVLQFTNKLHDVEIEKRQLLHELKRTDKENNQLESARSQILYLQQQIRSLNEQSQNQVPAIKYENLHVELKNALNRELQAEQIMKEQSEQLVDLAAKLDQCAQGEMEKEYTLTDIIESLSECKAELRKKEQLMCDLRKRLSQLQTEKLLIKCHMQGVESTLKTVSRDRDILASYLKSVKAAFEQAKQELSFTKDSVSSFSLPMLLSSDLIPSNIEKVGADLITCQNVVEAFVDAQYQAYRKIQVLTEEVASLKQHIASLKQEFAGVIHRGYDQNPTDVQWCEPPKVFPHTDPPELTSGKTQFFSLNEERDDSFVSPKIAKCKSTGSLNSKKNTNKAKKGALLKPSRQPLMKSRRSYNLKHSASTLCCS